MEEKVAHDLIFDEIDEERLLSISGKIKAQF
jgi:hypothetical protein